MNTALRNILRMSLGAGLLLTAACEQCEVDVKDGDTEETRTGFCSVDKFTTSDREGSAVLAADGTLTIDSINGSVTVEPGGGNEVAVSFSPFVFRAFNTEDSEIQRNWEQLLTTIEPQTGPDVTIDVSRKDGSPSTLGADIHVRIPSDFAGRLVVRQNNGGVDVDSGGATDVSIDSGNGSIDCSISSAPNVSVVTDNGSIECGIGVGGAVTVTSGNGDVSASIGTIADGATGGAISTELGDVVLGMPSSGDYVLQATARDSVDFGSPPSGCMEQAAAPNSKTLTCNEVQTPVFTATAEGVGGTVTVSY